jgi:acyl-homoserine lactone acylase PvdQ
MYIHRVFPAIALGTLLAACGHHDSDTAPSTPTPPLMLVYGQSTDPKSPYYADQLPLYSRKEWPALPFTEASINADPNRKTTTLAE